MSNPTPSNNLIEFIVAVMTIASTYFITKYQIINPNKISIRQQQLEKLYLPLYKLITDNNIESFNKDLLTIALDKAAPIIDENFLLVYPDLFQAYLDLRYSIESNQDIPQKYKRFSDIIFYDYEKLKRYLGYPSESYKDFFLRVDTPTKLKEILGFLMVILVFCGPIALAILLEKTDKLSFVKSIVILVGSLGLILKANDYLTSIQRRK